MTDWLINRERRDRILEVLFNIRPGEFALTTLLFAHFFCAVGVVSVGRSLRDVLFLAHYEASSLPWMYIYQALAVSTVSAVYARFADRVRKDLMAASSGLFMGMSLLVIRGAMHSQARWIYALLYVWIEVIASLSVIQFWNLANEMFNPREAKRLFGFIGAGGTVATIVLGSLMGPWARKLGTESLLFLCAALMVATFPLSRAVGRRNAARLSRPGRGRPGPKQTGGLVKVISSGHLRLVAMLGIVTFISTTLVDFQFKAIAKGFFAHEVDLTVFFGLFYAICGGLSLFMQLAGTSRVLSRYGVVVALTLLPVGLIFGTSVLVMLPVLWAATWAKGADNVLRYTINDATTQLLYLPVPANVRGAAKAAIDGVLKPGSIAIAGFMLLAYKSLGLGVRPIAIVTLVLIGLWLVSLARLRGQYIASLQDTLRRRRLDIDAAQSRIGDGATSEVILRALRSADAREVLNAIELLPHLPELSIDRELDVLLEHKEPAVRRAILEHLAKKPSLQHGNDVFRRFEDSDPAVRAAAVDAFCAIGRDRAVRSVRTFLKDPDPAIRSAAIVGMIRYGGLDGVLSAAEALKALIGDADPSMREHAARVLGEIGVRNFYQPVLELMADPMLRVQQAAIEAAGRLRSVELAPALVYRLARAETASFAVAALAEYGDGVVPLLDRVLKNQVEDLAVRRNVPRVLSAVRSPAAMQLLLEHLDEPDERLRASVAQAIRRAARRNRTLSVDKGRLAKTIYQELGLAYRALAQAETLALVATPGPDIARHGPEAVRALLHSALLEKVEAVEARAFALLAEVYPEAGIEFVYAGIRDASRRDATRLRANAVELLDNVLDRELKRRLLPLLEDSPRDAKLRAGTEIYPQPQRTTERTLMELLEDENAWVRACACMLVRELQFADARDALVLNLNSPWPVLREAALAALGGLPARDDLPLLIERARHDESPLVRERAEQVATAMVSVAPAASATPNAS